MTIKDVAEAAGVSPASVSIVIHGRKGVSDETRRRVQEVLDMPLAHLALLWRCNAHGSGVNRSGTFEEDDISLRLAELNRRP